MTATRDQALEATRRLRTSSAFRGLSAVEQASFGRDLERIERALGGTAAAPTLAPAPLAARPRRYGGDPYAIAAATPEDLQRDLSGPGGGSQSQPVRTGQAPAAAAPAPAPPPAKNPLADMKVAGEIVDAINFPAFVASLVTGTFRAIVDATAQQLREYGDLVANLSRSVEDFAAEHVTDDQVRASLVSKHPGDLLHRAPPPGQTGATRLEVTQAASGSSPAWLANYGLGGEQLTPELVSGPLVEAGRTRVAEQRMQSLAAMVLMGINRIVVNDGDIQAKLQFHAQLKSSTDVELATAQVNDGSIAQRPIGAGSGAPTLMVSTAKVNAQSDASAKTTLTGQVRIRFRTETFPLERFADSAAIQLLNRHARWAGDGKSGEAPAAPAAPAPGTPGSEPA
jgi:hypothetical protein